MTEPLWMPDQHSSSATILKAFRTWLSERTGQSLGDYGALHRLSTADQNAAGSAVESLCNAP